MTDDRALLVTGDDLVVAGVLRLAAAAGVEVLHERRPEHALGPWRTASLVLVGADAAQACASLDPPRRRGVLLVGTAPGPEIYRDALGCGAETVVELPRDDPLLVRALTDIADGDLGTPVVLGVLGGAGGVGCSVFATAVALTASRSRSTVLVDGDLLGAGVDQLLGLDASAGVRWPTLLDASGRLSGRAIRDALPRCPGPDPGLAVLSWPVERKAAPDVTAAREVVGALMRGFSVVVIDLPREGPWLDELLPRCSQLVMVSTTTLPALVSTARRLDRLLDVDTGLALRSRPGGLSAEAAQRFLQRPVLTVMGDQRCLDEDIALGVGPVRRRRGPLARAATEIAHRCLGP